MSVKSFKLELLKLKSQNDILVLIGWDKTSRPSNQTFLDKFSPITREIPSPKGSPQR